LLLMSSPTQDDDLMRRFVANFFIGQASMFFFQQIVDLPD